MRDSSEFGRPDWARDTAADGGDPAVIEGTIERTESGSAAGEVPSDVDTLRDCELRQPQTIADTDSTVDEDPLPKTDLYGTYFSDAQQPTIADEMAEARRADESTLAFIARGPDNRFGARESAWPKVPGYELLSKLGQGGMGVVYKARQEKLNRLVAIKMISDVARAGPRLFERFGIEAMAVARLQHPNIVQIYEIGEIDGLPFFSLELLTGGGLDAKLAKAPMPRREAAEMIVLLASAIQAAHEAQVVHRDLKPANVILAADGTPKITDFGLAKRLEEAGSSEKVGSSTEAGEVMGSPSYMSPEQALGKSNEVGPTADIYALGAILYEMLTGRPPFRGATVWETIKLVAHEEPVPPSRLQPRVPRDLETICLKCLLKEPNRRYETARDLAEDLRRFLAGEPILARPVPFWERGVKWVRRRPAFASLSAVAATMLVALVASGIWYARQRETHRIQRENDRIQSLALQAKQAASIYVKSLGGFASADRNFREGELNVAVSLLDDLRKSLDSPTVPIQQEAWFADLSGNVDALRVKVQAAQAARDEKKSFNEKFALLQSLRDKAHLFDSNFADLNVTDQGRGSLGPAAEAASMGLKIFAVTEGKGPLLLPAWLPAADRRKVEEWCCEMLLIRAEAEARGAPGEEPIPRAKAALRSLEMMRELAPDIPPTLAYRRRRAEYLELSGEHEAAALEFKAADSLKARDAFDHFLLGRDLSKRGDQAGAASEYREALNADPKRYSSRFSLAIAELNMSRPEVARVLLTDCIADRPGWAGPLLLRGFAWGKSGNDAQERSQRAKGPTPEPATWAVDFEKAESDFDALEALKPQELNLRYALYNNRGLVRFWAGRSADASADFHAAIELDPGRYNAWINLATLEFSRGDLAAAIAQLDKGIDRDPGPMGLAQLLRLRARVRSKQAEDAGQLARREAVNGRPDASESAQRAASELRRLALADLDAIPGKDDARTPDAVADLVMKAEILTLSGRHGDALLAADAALLIDSKTFSAHRWRIKTLLAREDFSGAERACDRYIAAGQPSPEIFNLRGLARSRSRNLEGAVDDYTQSLALQPRQANVLVDRGWVRLMLGDLSMALSDFDKAIALDPDNGDARSGRGNVQASRGRRQIALADANAALERGERTSLKLYRCARIYAQTGQNPRAVALLLEAVRLLPSPEREEYRENIGRDTAFKTLIPPVELRARSNERTSAEKSRMPTLPR